MRCATFDPSGLVDGGKVAHAEARCLTRGDGSGRDAEFRRRPSQTILTAEAGDPGSTAAGATRPVASG